ncbi:MAG: hypothetical protein DWQ35_03015 [Planctomycetota bacterium]|nr:MAG: hypothetical protein DWQ35_03015 [Planctomycetota bacterium]
MSRSTLLAIPPARILQTGIAVVLMLTAVAASPLAWSAEDDRDAAEQRRYRQLAPGVETVVPVARSEEETGEEHPIVEVKAANLAWDPQEAVAKSHTLDERANATMFRRGIWHLQFAFKPMRMIRVDVPQPNGRMKEKLVWYMVFRITNNGQHMTPEQSEEEGAPPNASTIARVDGHEQMLANIGPIRFIPNFTLRSYETGREYRDQIIPVAKAAIYRREQPPVELADFQNTVEISRRPIPVSTDENDRSVWGVVTWMDLNPTMDYFAVFLQGLTNAYKWSDPSGAYQAGKPPGTGRRFLHKTLKLNFSRTGDEFDQREEEIHLGIDGRAPGIDAQVDYEWVDR